MFHTVVETILHVTLSLRMYLLLSDSTAKFISNYHVFVFWKLLIFWIFQVKHVKLSTACRLLHYYLCTFALLMSIVTIINIFKLKKKLLNFLESGMIWNYVLLILFNPKYSSFLFNWNSLHEWHSSVLHFLHVSTLHQKCVRWYFLLVLAPLCMNDVKFVWLSPQLE